ncbi:hypothetical protein QMK19_34025, partial [Streptomyces sp. H10-C2]|uniref:hypothetical protein n=1 Tax=Streptomyces sp. H10-C2 TaxID=3046210 RepID=UPI0024B8D226
RVCTTLRVVQPVIGFADHWGPFHGPQGLRFAEPGPRFARAGGWLMGRFAASELLFCRFAAKDSRFAAGWQRGRGRLRFFGCR